MNQRICDCCEDWPATSFHLQTEHTPLWGGSGGTSRAIDLCDTCSKTWRDEWERLCKVAVDTKLTREAKGSAEIAMKIQTSSATNP